jgi:hypothetical protein
MNELMDEWIPRGMENGGRNNFTVRISKNPDSGKRDITL